MSCAAVPPPRGHLWHVGKIWGFALKTVFPAIKEWGARPVKVSQLPISVSQTIRHKKLHHKGLKSSALILQNPFLGRLVAPCCNYRGLKPPQPASFPQTKHPTLRFWSHSAVSCSTRIKHILVLSYDTGGTSWAPSGCITRPLGPTLPSHSWDHRIMEWFELERTLKAI